MIKKIIWLVVIVGLGFGIYKFFFACQKFDVSFAQNFTLSKMDYAKVHDEVYVKLLKITDNRYEENGVKKGQIEYKLLVVNDMRIQIVTLSTLEHLAIEIKKTDYTLHLVEGIDETKATFKLTILEEEE